jgi:hypothetical protein
MRHATFGHGYQARVLATVGLMLAGIAAAGARLLDALAR